jgi:hypothetical protein
VERTESLTGLTGAYYARCRQVQMMWTSAHGLGQRALTELKDHAELHDECKPDLAEHGRLCGLFVMMEQHLAVLERKAHPVSPSTVYRQAAGFVRNTVEELAAFFRSPDGAWHGASLSADIGDELDRFAALVPDFQNVAMIPFDYHSNRDQLRAGANPDDVASLLLRICNEYLEALQQLGELGGLVGAQLSKPVLIKPVLIKEDVEDLLAHREEQTLRIALEQSGIESFGKAFRGLAEAAAGVRTMVTDSIPAALGMGEGEALTDLHSCAQWLAGYFEKNAPAARGLLDRGRTIVGLAKHRPDANSDDDRVNSQKLDYATEILSGLDTRMAKCFELCAAAS